jgi:hypothetical protein
MVRTRSARSVLALVLACALATGAPSCGGGGGGEPADPVLFFVTATDPWDGEQGVDTDSLVRVSFSLPIDLSTVDATSIRLGRLGGVGEAYGVVGVVPGSGDTALEFTPLELLDPQVTYTVLVSVALRSTAGDALGGQSTFQFGTGGGVPLPQQSQLQGTNTILSIGRSSHTATRLLSGQVLIAGGYTDLGAPPTVTDRAERYEPAGEDFVLLSARMTQGRAAHTATLLADGRVLLAGGWHNPTIGSPLRTSRTAELYDPGTASFLAVGDMVSERVDHRALRLPDGRVLVTGGSRLVPPSTFEDLADAEVFDPSTNTWSPWPTAMAHVRAQHVMRDLGDGRWLLVGGAFDLRPEVFSTATGTFTTLSIPAAETARFGACAASFSDGDVAVAGGATVGSVLHFDAQASTLLNTGSGMNRPRSYATASPIGADRVLVVGGIDFSAGSFLLTSADLIVQGGSGGSRTFATGLVFPTPMAGHTATVLLDGRVLFTGGINPFGGLPEIAAAYLFTP